MNTKRIGFLNLIELVLAGFILLWMDIGIAKMPMANLPSMAKYGVFIAWLLIVSIDKTPPGANKIFSMQTVSLAAFFLYVLLVNTIMGDNGIQHYVMATVYFFMSVCVGMEYTKPEKKLLRNALLIVFAVDYIVVGVKTLVILEQFPLAARWLSSGAKNEYLLEDVDISIFGSYGFINALVPVTISLLCFWKRYRAKGFIKNVIRWSALAFYILLFIISIEASYVFALATIFIASICIIAFKEQNSRKNNILRICVSFIAAFLVFICLTPIMSSIASSNLPDEVRSKATQIIHFLQGNDSAANDVTVRLDAYLQAILSFLRNPIFGAGIIGDNSKLYTHSTIEDLLGMFGLLSFLAFGYVNKLFSNMKKIGYFDKYLFSTGVVWFVITCLINPIFYSPILIAWFAYFPMICTLLGEETIGKRPVHGENDEKA